MKSWMRKRLRWIFFTLHFGGGFLLLWLVFKLTLFSFFPMQGVRIGLEALTQTGYLVAGVIWGNVGWDAFKNIPSDASPSLLIYVLTRTLTPVLVLLPIFTIICSVFFEGHYLYWKQACTWQNGVFLSMAIIALLLQRLYRRSESGFFYRTWGI